MRPRPLVLLLLDGWGVASETRGNPLSLAEMPSFFSLVADYPAMVLEAAGESVGLPRNASPSCEHNYAVIGAGRSLPTPYVYVDEQIRKNILREQPTVKHAVKKLHEHEGALHLVGLLSTGAVQSHIDHLFSILELARRENIERVYIHAVLDGIDSPSGSSMELLERLHKKCKELRLGKLVSVVGRQFALDTRGDWDKVSAAYTALIRREAGSRVKDIRKAVRAQRKADIRDEDMGPIILSDEHVVIGRSDVVWFFNAEPEADRHLLAALCNADFKPFRRPYLRGVEVLTMLPVMGVNHARPIFTLPPMSPSLSELISKAGLRQAMVAETERFAQLLLFGQYPYKSLSKEDRFLLPSVATPAAGGRPELRTIELVNRLVQLVLSERYDFIVANIAAADVVAHTRQVAAGIEAVKVIDLALQKIKDAVLAKDGVLLITSDHGAIEGVEAEPLETLPQTHTTNRVPFLVVADALHGKTADAPDIPSGNLALAKSAGSLVDIAPTILKILELPIPPAMTGAPLL